MPSTSAALVCTPSTVESVLQQRALDAGHVALHAHAFGKTAPGAISDIPAASTCGRGAGLGAFGGKFDVQFVGRFQGNGALDSVLQLADVARPLVAAESVERGRVDAQNAAARGGGVLLQKVIHQQRNVFAALAQAAARGWE